VNTQIINIRMNFI